MRTLPKTVINPLRLKISQCQGILAQLQETYERDQLKLQTQLSAPPSAIL